MKIETGSLYKHKSLDHCYLIYKTNSILRICHVLEFGIINAQCPKFLNNHTKHTFEFIEDCCLLISE